jgi:hypothetical protein
MKNFFLLGALLVLSACPSGDEIKIMQQGIAEKKAQAVRALEGANYSLENLLIVQDYFFDFTEKVHLIKVEPEARKNLQKMLSAKGGIQNFCQNFILPLSLWRSLETFCTAGPIYKCSPEISSYPNSISQLKNLLGPALATQLTDQCP